MTSTPFTLTTTPLVNRALPLTSLPPPSPPHLGGGLASALGVQLGVVGGVRRTWRMMKVGRGACRKYGYHPLPIFVSAFPSFLFTCKNKQSK